MRHNTVDEERVSAKATVTPPSSPFAPEPSNDACNGGSWDGTRAVHIPFQVDLGYVWKVDNQIEEDCQVKASRNERNVQGNPKWQQQEEEHTREWSARAERATQHSYITFPMMTLTC